MLFPGSQHGLTSWLFFSPLGPTIKLARERAQMAADVMAQWAQKWKMTIAGEKTQALVLSHWSPDARNFHIKVSGTTVEGCQHLKLLGVTFDRLLHFGEHSWSSCAS